MLLKKHSVKAVSFLLLTLVFLFLSGYLAVAEDHTYGVFLSVTGDLRALEQYDTVVIDAQYFTKEAIDAFRGEGHTVYSYLNIGSLETFRPYHNRFNDLILGPYENWNEEYWIDASDGRWQDFIIRELVPALLQKDVDGFFVDNCDVYDHYPTESMLDGLTAMLQALVGTGKAVLHNGGDVSLDAYCAGGGQWDEVITGINQETVFSKILWDGDRFGRATQEDRAYFTDYIERYAALGADIYLLEYTHSNPLKADIYEYC